MKIISTNSWIIWRTIPVPRHKWACAAYRLAWVTLKTKMIISSFLLSSSSRSASSSLQIIDKIISEMCQEDLIKHRCLRGFITFIINIITKPLGNRCHCVIAYLCVTEHWTNIHTYDAKAWYCCEMQWMMRVLYYIATSAGINSPFKHPVVIFKTVRKSQEIIMAVGEYWFSSLI